MYSFPWVLLAHPSGCNQEFPYFPQISKYVSILLPNTESGKNIEMSGLSLELVTHFFITISICISMYYASIFIQTEHKDIEVHTKYSNKKWVTNSKGAINFIQVNRTL